ncbi:MAG: dienelactone hydrolase family protein [Solirubrobacteraceae bacterium]|nr:dienelactone hydrolase family protein [Solirubrobacteraceae bacterium]
MTASTAGSLACDEFVVPCLDGAAMPAYAAWPWDAAQLPVAVVFGELFGLNAVQRETADSVAKMGYVAIAPSLLHRRAGGGPIAEDAEGRERALAVASELTRLEVASDARDALGVAWDLPAADATAPAIAVGVSFGGHAALVSSALLGLRACAALYAGWVAGTEIALSRPAATAEFAAPLLAAAGTRTLLLTGQADPMVPAVDLDRTVAALTAAGAAVERYDYPGVGHRFAAVGKPGYDDAAAADAWARVEAFLAGV